MDSQNQFVLDTFNKLFTPVVEFPRWFQPNKDIGAILVTSQEEEDELRARDWTPRPLPGSEAPVAKISSMTDVGDALEVLQNERDLLEQEKATWRAEMDAKMARLEAMLSAASGTPGVPPSADVSSSDTPASADVPGGLSDASDDVTDPPAPAPAPAAKSSKK